MLLITLEEGWPSWIAALPAPLLISSSLPPNDVALQPAPSPVAAAPLTRIACASWTVEPFTFETYAEYSRSRTSGRDVRRPPARIPVPIPGGPSARHPARPKERPPFPSAGRVL